MKLQRSIHLEPLADLGNGVRLDLYWPEANVKPFFYFSQKGYGQAALKPEQIRPLIEVLEQIEEALWEL